MKPIKLHHMINTDIEQPVSSGLTSISAKCIMAQHQKILHANTAIRTNGYKSGGVLTTSNGKKIATIGKYGLTPEQLTEVKNGLKPGMDKQVERNLKKGLPLSKACPDHVWKSGNVKTFTASNNSQKHALTETVSKSAEVIQASTSPLSKQTTTASIKSAPVILGVMAAGVSAVNLASKFAANGIQTLTRIQSITGERLDQVMSIAKNGINLENLGLPDIQAEINAALARIPDNLIAGLKNPQDLTQLAQDSLTAEARKALPTGSLDILKEALDNPSKFMPTTEKLEALASNKIASLEGQASAKQAQIMGQFSDIQNKASAIASQAASVLANPPEINMPGLNKQVQQSTALLSAAGDSRIPPLQ